MVQIDMGQLSTRLSPVGVTDLRPLAGGASSLTFAGELHGSTVVVKVAPPGVPPTLNRDVLRQARLIRALGPTAVPVPEVLWEEAGAPPEVPPLFVMSYIDGTSVEPLFDLDVEDLSAHAVRERMCDAARVLASLHRVQPASVGLHNEPVLETKQEVERWCRLLQTVDQALVPRWERVADLLQRTAPAPLSAVIVHGDFRLGNLLSVGGCVTAVIDWEIWSVGDPRIDVGWFLLNADPSTYRRPTRFVDVSPPPVELASIYTEALGRHVPDLAWFQALASFKSAATWSLIVKHNRRRDHPNPEYEAIAVELPRLLERAEQHLG
jgi:aminoglycoside phosphotransferase (APT) family kinase protein